MEGLVGNTIGSYSITNLLAKGDTSEIYLGEHIQTHKRATLKIISLATGTEQSLSEEEEEEEKQEQGDLDHGLAVLRLQAEARLLARFNHLHIIRPLEVGTTSEAAYTALEYIRDASFYHRHRKGKALTPAIILSYIKQLADTLYYLHSLGVLHRHLKPEHLLLAPGNRLVLCGFGQALSPWEDEPALTQQLIGTPLYMAPEQFEGHALAASDQYALAIMVYEWFCGEPPFSGSTDELKEHHLHTPPPPFAEKQVKLAPEIEQVVLQALAKEPDERFNSISDFARSLEKACTATGTEK